MYVALNTVRKVYLSYSYMCSMYTLQHKVKKLIKGIIRPRTYSDEY